MKLSRLKNVALAAGILGLAALPSAAQVVDLELALVVDESFSVDAGEYALQMQGYVNAFQNPLVHAAIASNPNGIAVSLIVFASDGQNTTEVDWTLLTGAASSNAFAAAIAAAAATREFEVPGNTGIADAVRETRTLITTNTFLGNKLVIDVSGDGPETGESDAILQQERDLSAAADIEINGLAILTDVPTLATYYTNNLITPGGFVEVATGFDDFEDAIVRKLQAEITGDGAPEPGTFALLGVGALAFGGLVARRKKA